MEYSECDTRADGDRCCKCGAGENLEVDHIKPIHYGGEDASSRTRRPFATNVTLARATTRRG
jgi:5-methylcytosine-specific restriction endonuclease McrA